VWQKLVPGAQGQPHTTIRGAGHFLQEDKGPEIARAISDLIRATPRK
jgi:haloalkane dehalogenase